MSQILPREYFNDDILSNKINCHIHIGQRWLRPIKVIYRKHIEKWHCVYKYVILIYIHIKFLLISFISRQSECKQPGFVCLRNESEITMKRYKIQKIHSLYITSYFQSTIISDDIITLSLYIQSYLNSHPLLM